MKYCPKCKRTLVKSDFNWKIKNVKLAVYCKECSRNYIRNHYRKNKKYYLDKASLRNSKIKQLAVDYLGKYLSEHPCVDCGETDLLVLEFDYIEKTSKSYNVSVIIKNTGSVDKLKEEVSKCDVRCANCHRRKTAKESNSWKLFYAPVA